MARAKQSEKNNGATPNEIDFSKDIGITVYRDVEHSAVMNRFPTMIPQLDYILGGGLPFGRMVEIIGKNSSGKCLTKDTRLLTPTGYKTLETIFRESGQEPYTVVKEVEARVPLINMDGEVEYTSHLTFNGKRPIYEVTTYSGTTIKVTSNHPLRTITEGVHGWTKAQLLKEGDYLVTRRGDKVASETDSTTLSEAYLLGILVADGYFGEHRISFSNNEESLISFVKTFLDNHEISYKLYDKPCKDGSLSQAIVVNNASLIPTFYEKYGIHAGVAKDKYVPPVVMNGSLDVQKAFLEAYMDCECSIDTTKTTLELSSASKRLLEEVQLLLKNMGVIGLLREKVVKGYEQNWYGRLAISGNDITILDSLIRFATPKRVADMETMVAHLETARVQSNHDICPIGSLGVSYLKSTPPESRKRGDIQSKQLTEHGTHRKTVKALLELNGDPKVRPILEHAMQDCYYYDKIVSIKLLDPEPTFDVCMPETHSFIAEGIINHNSTYAVAMTRICQWLKVPCVWIDVEGTADPARLAELGVDFSAGGVYMVEPDKKKNEIMTIELVAKKLEAVVGAFSKSGEPLVIIWDSVAQTPAQTEIDRGVGDKQPGY